MTDTPKRRPGRPNGTTEGRKLLGNLALPPEQIDWLKRQGRPASKTIQSLIDKEMGNV